MSTRVGEVPQVLRQQPRSVLDKSEGSVRTSRPRSILFAISVVLLGTSCGSTGPETDKDSPAQTVISTTTATSRLDLSVEYLEATSVENLVSYSDAVVVATARVPQPSRTTQFGESPLIVTDSGLRCRFGGGHERKRGSRRHRAPADHGRRRCRRGLVDRRQRTTLHPGTEVPPLSEALSCRRFVFTGGRPGHPCRVDRRTVDRNDRERWDVESSPRSQGVSSPDPCGTQRC